MCHITELHPGTICNNIDESEGGLRILEYHFEFVKKCVNKLDIFYTAQTKTVLYPIKLNQASHSHVFLRNNRLEPCKDNFRGKEDDLASFRAFTLEENTVNNSLFTVA